MTVFFIYCMLFYSLYVQLLSFSFTVICAVHFVYLFFFYYNMVYSRVIMY